MLHVLPYAGHCFCRSITQKHLQLSIDFFSFRPPFCCLFWLNLCLSLLIESSLLHPLYLLILLYMAFVLLLSGSTLSTETCSLPAQLLSFRTVNSLIMSAVMASLFTPLMKCSFSLLLFSWYLHSSPFIHNLPIHSCADSSIFLLNVHNNIVSLCCGMNSQ